MKSVLLADRQLAEFKRSGHLTVPAVFADDTIRSVLEDLDCWSREYLATLSETDRHWYVEAETEDSTRLRKLDHPAFHRRVFRDLGTSPPLLSMVGQLIGPVGALFFSQVFMKPPGGGGPKPIHQDNYYFGPDDPDATLTAWVALDEATTSNGCLEYADTHVSEVAAHFAPTDHPFNLQLPQELASRYAMVAAPVPSGGVSFHHGNTPHRSSSNLSDRPRRAVAFHYLRQDAVLAAPALPYNDAFRIEIEHPC
jgi:hypothetical protein